MILFNAKRETRDFPEGEVAAAIASGEWATNLAHFGIETCPGVEPDPVIAARRAELEQKPKEGPESLDKDALLELAEQRGVTVDKRWGLERLRAVLRGDSA